MLRELLLKCLFFLLVPCQLAAGSALAAATVYRSVDIARVVLGNALGGVMVGLSVTAVASLFLEVVHWSVLVFVAMGIAPLMGPVAGAAIYGWEDSVARAQIIECGMLGSALVYLATVCGCYIVRGCRSHKQSLKIAPEEVVV